MLENSLTFEGFLTHTSHRHNVLDGESRRSSYAICYTWKITKKYIFRRKYATKRKIYMKMKSMKDVSLVAAQLKREKR